MQDSFLVQAVLFSAHNGYVGMKVAEDNSHVIPLYYALIGNWTNGCSHTYIDNF